MAISDLIALAKKKIWLIAIIAVVLILIISGLAGKNKDKAAYKFASAQKKDLVQIVSATGKVNPSKTIDLAFERSGKVKKIFFQIGDEVKKGQLIIELENSTLAAQRRQAQANLEAQIAKLREMQVGARSEQLQVSQSTLDKAEGELSDFYKNAAVTINQAHNISDQVFREDLKSLFNYYSNNNPPLYQLNYYPCDSVAYNLANARRYIVDNKLDAWHAELSDLGLSAPEKTDQLMENSNSYLAYFQEYLNILNKTLVASCSLDTASQSQINTYRPLVSAAITSFNSAFSDVKALRKSVNSQKMLVQNYKDQLNLTAAKATQEQIDYQNSQVNAMQASVDIIDSQIRETKMFAPIEGVIKNIVVEEGEIVSANQNCASMISDDFYQIEAYINETDVAKIKVGNRTEIIFEAFGSQKPFNGEVIKIDPAQTIVENVVTYKTTFKIDNFDPIIKPGMTADVDIITAQKDNVISVPQRAIIKKNGQTFVSIMENSQIKEVQVAVGIKGSSGDVEIISGLKEGQEVIVSQ